ncbi:hypothetical protein PMY56_17925 [Clostridium tertium]|jgi:hypothetical protein|uniref:Lipoprotein n=3 Tax=Clostridium tertium TaxID=1559 RepID=A0A9X4AZM0_9CLOT|nr:MULTISPECIES: hypothetical protein [Clostridium]MBS5307603.1 hypothetical protein [Clostridium sp.]MDB1924349.1 hypothetical protein [Clostridium tertium]MDB1928009.1 hypothetical protein [Clostridium tertium]MDB1931426.1 hypothetical protein [Clostridium tertium]MDB1945551.1 hypothetical protein [Clostridium tertium]
MKTKKIFLLLISLLITFNFTSCKNSNSKDNTADNNSIEENVQSDNTIKEEPKVPTSFEAFGKSYTSSKDINSIEKSTNVYDDQTSIYYTAGEYKEIDFINDLLYSYLNEDNSIYNYLISYSNTNEKGYEPISESDKEKLKKDLSSLRSQMDLANGEEMVVRLDRVTYEGLDPNTNSGHSFKIRVAISRVGATIVPWNYFTVTVFEDGNKLMAHLF